METVVRDGKTFVKVNNLKPWDRNPRNVKPEDFERLKSQITLLGQHTPLIINEEGTVFGGNMRLKAYKELGIEEAFVFIIPKEKENLAIQYALSSNDNVGFYEDKLLAELLRDNSDVDLNIFKAQLSEAIDLTKLVDALKPQHRDKEGGEYKREQDTDPTDKDLDNFINGTIRQIVLYFDVPSYETAQNDLTEIRKYFEVEDNTSAFLKLVEFWKQRKDEKA